jgi:hypothetical protein
MIATALQDDLHHPVCGDFLGNEAEFVQHTRNRPLNPALSSDLAEIREYLNVATKNVLYCNRVDPCPESSVRVHSLRL